MNKKLTYLLLVVFCIISLTGCESLFENDSTSYYNQSYDMPTEQTYTTKIYSIPQENMLLGGKNTNIGILSNYSRLDRTLAFEKEIAEQLVKNNISAYSITEKYYQYIDPEKGITTPMLDKMYEDKNFYLLLINVDDWSEYEYGGGIADMVTTIHVHDILSEESLALVMTTLTSCNENKMESFNQTYPKVDKSIAEAIAEELQKYILSDEEYEKSLIEKLASDIVDSLNFNELEQDNNSENSTTDTSN